MSCRWEIMVWDRSRFIADKSPYEKARFLLNKRTGGEDRLENGLRHVRGKRADDFQRLYWDDLNGNRAGLNL